jgi:hypothetical protein
MKWRNISEQEVEAVLSVPDKVEPTERGRTNAFRRFGSRHLKVTYREFPEEILIISAVDKCD